jgi:hypothetical protein
MQSVCGAYELLFWDVSKLTRLPDGATQLKDEKWATYTVKLGWWVQGVFPPACDGSHVNGVDRTKDEKIIVTADDWGLVNLYKNPCMKVNNINLLRAERLILTEHTHPMWYGRSSTKAIHTFTRWVVMIRRL